MIPSANTTENIWHYESAYQMFLLGYECLLTGNMNARGKTEDK